MKLITIAYTCHGFPKIERFRARDEEAALQQLADLKPHATDTRVAEVKNSAIV